MGNNAGEKANNEEEPCSSSSIITDAGDECSYYSMPFELRQKILSHLSYHEIALLRPTCKMFDNDCKYMLNDGLRKFHDVLINEKTEVKKQLPRRESDQRKHHLFAYSEILSSLKNRYELLMMSYRKYLDRDAVCFIPGLVLDEGFKVLRRMEKQKNPQNANPNILQLAFTHDVLKEFRDLTRMAMEHFDEVIVPRMKPDSDMIWPLLKTIENSPSSVFFPSFSSFKRRFVSPSPALPVRPRVNLDQLQHQVNEHTELLTKQDLVIASMQKTIIHLVKYIEELSEWVDKPLDTEKLREILEEPYKGEEELGDFEEEPQPGPSGLNQENKRKRKAENDKDEVLLKKAKSLFR